MPWWAEAGQVDLEGDWIEQMSLAHVRRMAQTFSRQPAAIERLVQQFSIGFITKLLNLLSPDRAGDVLEGWRWLEESDLDRGTPYAELRRGYWIYWISKTAGTPPDQSRISRVLKRWLQDSPQAKARIKSLLDDARSGWTDSSKKSVLAALEELLASALEVTTETTPAEPAKEHIPEQPIRDDHPEKLRDHRRTPAVSERDTPDQIRETGLEQEPPGIRRSPPAPEKPDFVSNGEPRFRLQEDETALYVEAAGLVLLHPFLPELFRMARLWKDKEWISPQAPNAAVHLVGWLAHGETNLPEYRLLMPKLLCGLPWELPLDSSITLEEDQIRFATELLEAVVGHWRALGKTSIDGLREAFILREGRLAPTTDGWRLTVEKRALDILLGKLPWGISVIQLPWLRGTRIHVDWA